MAYAHVDPQNGVDSSGRGSVANPYRSIQYANDDAANWADGAASATATNVIYLWNTAPTVLTSVINITIATVDARLVIEGYDGGGSLTCTLPWGRTSICGEIDGNDAVASIMSGESYIILRKIKAHSTTSYVVLLAANGTLEDCHVYNGNYRSVFLSQNGTLRNTYVNHDLLTAGQISAYVAGNVFNCEIVGGDIGLELAGVGDIVEGTLIHGMTTVGVRPAQEDQKIRGCTIDGTGASSSAKGIYSQFAFYEGGVVVDCLITNFSGASACGIQDYSSGAFEMMGNNHFWNNTANESLTHQPHRIAADVTLGADPYTNAAANDYSLVEGSAAIDAALFSNPDPDNPLNVGAWQDLTCTGGGGGGGENVSVSIT